MNQVENKGRVVALLPIGVFLVIFLGSGIVTGDFYAMPAIVAFLIALAVAFMQNKELSFAEKLSVISKGLHRLLLGSVKRLVMRWRFALVQLCVVRCLVITYR